MTSLPAALEPLARQLAGVGARAVGRGLVLGSGGNLSARAPGGEALVVTVSGAWLDELDDPRAWAVVALADGRQTLGAGAPTSELAMHLAAHRARPDRAALVHLHPQASVLLDALGEPVRLVTIDHAYYVREVRRTPFLQSGSTALADAVAAEHVRDGGCDCVVLAHHGWTRRPRARRAAGPRRSPAARVPAPRAGPVRRTAPPGRRP